MKRQKREERLELIRTNVQLKYAMKRKVSSSILLKMIGLVVCEELVCVVCCVQWVWNKII